MCWCGMAELRIENIDLQKSHLIKLRNIETESFICGGLSSLQKFAFSYKIYSNAVVPKLYKSRPTFQNINFQVPHSSACTGTVLRSTWEKVQ